MGPARSQHTCLLAPLWQVDACHLARADTHHGLAHEQRAQQRPRRLREVITQRARSGLPDEPRELRERWRVKGRLAVQHFVADDLGEGEGEGWAWG